MSSILRKSADKISMSALLLVIALTLPFAHGEEQLSTCSCQTNQMKGIAPLQEIVNKLPTSRLLVNKIGEADFEDCFVKEREVHQVQFEYKEVYAPGLNKIVHLRAYVNYPPNYRKSKNVPVILMFHGGSWKNGSPLVWQSAGLTLASKGFATISFQYRLEDIHHSTAEESTEDARSALLWVEQNAKSLGLDKNRMVVSGDSAGAHLALSAVLLNESSKEFSGAMPKAIIGLYPVVETKSLGHDKISPMDLTKGKDLPPTLLLQGAQDDHPWTPPRKTQEFCKEVGSKCQVKFFPGKEFFHGFLGAEKQYARAMEEIEKFLASQRLMEKGEVSSMDDLLKTPKACHAGPDDELYKKWLSDYGYSSNQSSIW